MDARSDGGFRRVDLGSHSLASSPKSVATARAGDIGRVAPRQPRGRENLEIASTCGKHRRTRIDIASASQRCASSTPRSRPRSCATSRSTRRIIVQRRTARALHTYPHIHLVGAVSPWNYQHACSRSFEGGRQRRRVPARKPSPLATLVRSLGELNNRTTSRPPASLTVVTRPDLHRRSRRARRRAARHSRMWSGLMEHRQRVRRAPRSSARVGGRARPTTREASAGKGRARSSSTTPTSRTPSTGRRRHARRVRGPGALGDEPHLAGHESIHDDDAPVLLAAARRSTGDGLARRRRRSRRDEGQRRRRPRRPRRWSRADARHPSGRRTADRLVFDLAGVLYVGATVLAHVRAQRAFLRERFGMSAEEASRRFGDRRRQRIGARAGARDFSV